MSHKSNTSLTRVTSSCGKADHFNVKFTLPAVICSSIKQQSQALIVLMIHDMHSCLTGWNININVKIMADLYGVWVKKYWLHFSDIIYSSCWDHGQFSCHHAVRECIQYSPQSVQDSCLPDFSCKELPLAEKTTIMASILNTWHTRAGIVTIQQSTI